jgi:predicted permease
MLIKTPLATAAVICSLALGVGANVAFFAVINAVILKPLAVSRPEELILIKRTTLKGVEEDFPYPVVEWLQKDSQTLAGIYGWHAIGVSARFNQQTEKLKAELVSDNYFTLLGLRPYQGTFLDSGSEREAVISYRYWQDRLAGQNSVVGSPIFVNGIPFTIAGVAPPGFFGMEVGLTKDLWLPISTAPEFKKTPSLLTSDSQWWVNLIGRLQPNANALESQTELTLLFHGYLRHTMGNNLTPEDEADIQRETITLEAGGQGVSRLRKNRVESLYWLVAASITTLLIVCSNVASLLIARLGQRRREFAIRLALGASRSALSLQLMIESAMLSGLAVIAGLLVSDLGLQFIPGMVFGPQVQLDVSLDWRVLLFAFCLMVGGIFLFSLLAAVWIADRSILDDIRPYDHAASKGRTQMGGHLRHLPLLLQVSLSMVLALQTSLFVQTFLNLKKQELGFESNNLAFFQIDASEAGYSGPAFISFQSHLMDQLRQLPAVESVSYSRNLPMSAAQIVTGSIKAEGRTDSIRAEVQLIEPGFFDTMRIPFIKGAGFGDTLQTAATSIPVVVNETFAQRYFQEESPLDRRLTLSSTLLEIKGVVRDGKYHSYRETPLPILYVPYMRWRAEPWGLMTVLVRTRVQAASSLPQIEAGMRELSQNALITQARLMTSYLDELLVQERSLVRMTGLMSLLGLILVGLGTYSLVAQFVNRRLRELAIRMALGAKPTQVIWLCSRRLALVIVAGVLIGYLLANSLTQLTASLLFGTSGIEPLSLLGSISVIMIAAAIGAGAPLAKVLWLNPAVLLRYE